MTASSAQFSPPVPHRITGQQLDSLLRSSSTPLAVLEMPTNRVVDANAALAELLRRDIPELLGLDVVSIIAPDDRAVVASVCKGVADGSIQSCQGRAAIRLPSGKHIDVIGWIRPVDALDPDGRALLALAAAQGPCSAAHPLMTDRSSATLCTLDHEARFVDIGRDARTLLGWDVESHRGTPMQAVVHPDDAPLLVLAFGRSSAERRGTAINLRLGRHEGPWALVRCHISPLCEHTPPRFAVSMWAPAPNCDPEGSVDRATRLEAHLWRIGVELKAAGIADVPVLGELSWSDPAIRELSDRQVEVLRRLVRGERVRGIAEDLYLSPSTVRNHLVAIYRKLGVHSQSELLARLRADRSLTEMRPPA